MHLFRFLFSDAREEIGFSSKEAEKRVEQLNNRSQSIAQLYDVPLRFRLRADVQ